MTRKELPNYDLRLLPIANQNVGQKVTNVISVYSGKTEWVLSLGEPYSHESYYVHDPALDQPHRAIS